MLILCLVGFAMKRDTADWMLVAGWYWTGRCKPVSDASESARFKARIGFHARATSRPSHALFCMPLHAKRVTSVQVNGRITTRGQARPGIFHTVLDSALEGQALQACPIPYLQD